ncbi:hypothetical protein HY382_03035 [Candidatus Curtissbacteria bacterium]|nr:hypothetical protein [Candidatus Curtissbacteria bacterium]
MPKNTPLIAGAIAIVIAILVGGYLVMNKKSPSTSQPTTTQEQTAEDEGIVKGSIKSLLSGGKNVTCSVKYPMGDSAYEGKVFVAGSKMRGDFTTAVEGKTMESHMISDGTYTYSWASGMPQGVKMKMDETQTQASPVAGQSQQLDVEKQVDMNCSNWSVDNSVFTPPADIKFMDIGAITKPASSPAAGQTQQNQGSSICDQITDPQAKAACLGAGY